MLTVAQVETPVEDPASSPANSVWLPNVLLAAAVALLVVVVLGKSRRKAISKSREIVPTPQERLAELRHRAENDAGIEARVAQAADQIRELTAHLDTRIQTLDVLIEQADQRIAQLAQAGPGSQPTVQNGSASRPEPANSDSQKRAIYELADQGLTPAEIAARLGQHAGKIELILALRRV